MKMTHKLGVFAIALLMIASVIIGAPSVARAGQSQAQTPQSSNSKKSPPPSQKKSNAKELSEDEGGARGFQLPGDGSQSKPNAKTPAKKTKAGEKASNKAASDRAPKQQP